MNSKESGEAFERVLAVCTNSKGVSFALMQGPLTILEKQMKNISPITNVKVEKEIIKLIGQFKPERVILEDPESQYSRKGTRAKQLHRSLLLKMKKQNVKVNSYTREDIRFVFEIWKAKTKYEIAQVIAFNIPTMKLLLYPKPKYPSQQDYFEGVFDAISLGITYYYKTT